MYVCLFGYCVNLYSSAILIRFKCLIIFYKQFSWCFVGPDLLVYLKLDINLRPISFVFGSLIPKMFFNGLKS